MSNFVLARHFGQELGCGVANWKRDLQLDLLLTFHVTVDFFLFHNLWYAKVAPNASETLEGEIRRTLAVQMRYNKEMKKANATQSSLCWGITLFMLGRKKTSYAFLNRFTSSQMISGVCFFIFFIFKHIFPISAAPLCPPKC